MGSINSNASTPQTTLKRLMSRVETLLDKKQDNLNAVNVNKYLRCRIIIKVSSQEFEDFIKKVHRTITMFDVQCDDEIITN